MVIFHILDFYCISFLVRKMFVFIQICLMILKIPSWPSLKNSWFFNDFRFSARFFEQEKLQKQLSVFQCVFVFCPLLQHHSLKNNKFNMMFSIFNFLSLVFWKTLKKQMVFQWFRWLAELFPEKKIFKKSCVFEWFWGQESKKH